MFIFQYNFFVKNRFRVLNQHMKKTFSSVKNNLVSRYLLENESMDKAKTADVNVLLNRVKLDRKREGRKKLLFSASASAGIVLFCILIF